MPVAGVGMMKARFGLGARLNKSWRMQTAEYVPVPVINELSAYLFGRVPCPLCC